MRKMQDHVRSSVGKPQQKLVCLLLVLGILTAQWSTRKAQLPLHKAHDL